MFEKRSIKWKLIFGFGMLLSLMVSTNLLLLQRMSISANDMSSIVGDRVLKVHEANELLDGTQSNGRALLELLLVDSADERASVKQRIIATKVVSSDLITKFEGQLVSADAKALFPKIREQLGVVQALYEPYFALVENSTEEGRAFLATKLIPAIDLLGQSLKEMVSLQEAHMHRQAEADRDRLKQSWLVTGGLLAVACVLGIGAAILITRAIIRPVERMRASMRDIRRNYDFSQPMQVYSSDEIGETAAEFNELLSDLRAIFTELKSAVDEVGGAAEELSGSAAQSAQASELTSESAASMAACVEQVSVAISVVSDNAHSASDLALEGGRRATEGGAVIENTVNEVQKIGDSIQTVSGAMIALNGETSKISKVLDLIRDIADRTNLLALNAAIEAARAGDAGRGFAVVADEVRNLSVVTREATADISCMISSIESSSREAGIAMQVSLSEIENGRDLATGAGASISEIRAATERIVEMVSDIANSISEQSSASQAMAQQLEQVAQAAEQNSAAATDTARAALHLQSLSRGMRQQASKFIV